ncbi:TlpA family protein disulfide reductase [Pedobacter sp. UC225_65]|uniref:TlpA family protein disulfide reductase n=1 Tax=Pedobacter sp. UC225_65 TaxID=3350173 RepID=UPI0036701933
MAKNYYYVKLIRQNYKDKSSYFEKLANELRDSLATKKAINSTFLNSAMYYLGNYNKNKNNLNYNLKTFIEELTQINTEKRFKTGIAFQALFDFSEKESKMYAESHALFNRELNDPIFQKQSYASLIVPDENAVDKKTIKLVSTTKEPLSLADIFKKNKGKVIVFDLWASWCIPCINEFPFLEKTKVKFLDKNVVFIGIGLDKDNKEKDWKNILPRSKISAKNQFRVIESSNKLISTLYKIETIPRYLVFDKDGMLVNDHFSKPSEQDFERKLLSYISAVSKK